MGAQTFINFAKGNSPEEAFSEAVSRARWDYGNSGYTGTIAEKSEFKVIPTPPEFDNVPLNEIHHAVGRMIDESIDRCNNEPGYKPPFWDDKWGPAACVDVGDGYVFFGWASS